MNSRNSLELQLAAEAVSRRMQEAGFNLGPSAALQGLSSALYVGSALGAGRRAGHTPATLPQAAKAAHASIVAAAAARRGVANSNRPTERRQTPRARDLSQQARGALVAKLNAAGFLRDQHPTDEEILAAVDDAGADYSKYYGNAHSPETQPAVEAEYAKYYTAITT